MSENESLWSYIKGWIGNIGYSLFLWSLGMTNDEFIDEVYYIEKVRLETADDVPF